MKIKIYTRANCSNCKAMKEILKKFPEIEVEEINAEENREYLNTIQLPKGWQLPLMEYFEGDKRVNIST